LAFELDGPLAVLGGDALGWGLGGSAMLFQALEGSGLPAAEPLPDGLGRGRKVPGGGFHPVRFSKPDQFKSEIFGVVTLPVPPHLTVMRWLVT